MHGLGSASQRREEKENVFDLPPSGAPSVSDDRSPKASSARVLRVINNEYDGKLGTQQLLEQLEAENATLRNEAIALALQIQELREVHTGDAIRLLRLFGPVEGSDWLCAALIATRFSRADAAASDWCCSGEAHCVPNTRCPG